MEEVISPAAADPIAIPPYPKLSGKETVARPTWIGRLSMGSGRTPKVFICYRREDSEAYAGRIRDRLVPALDEKSVFMDVDSITPGADFQRVLAETVGQSDVLLTVIGPRWLECRDESGRSRIDNKDDYVRREIMTAVDRKVAILPVLVGGARMPNCERLPLEIRPLAGRQAVQVNHSSWGRDIAKLLDAVRQLSKTSKPRSGSARKDFQTLEVLAKHWKLSGALASLVLVAMIAGFWWSPASEGKTTSVAPPAEVPQGASERPASGLIDPSTAVVTMPPSNVSALRRLFTNALARRDFEGALQSIKEAMAVKPDDPDVQKDLEQLLSTIGIDLVRAFQQMPSAPADPLLATDYRNALKSREDATRFAQAGHTIEAVQSLITAKQYVERAFLSARSVSPPIPPSKGSSRPDVVDAQRAEIETVLHRYVEAYKQRDSAAIRRVWPSVPATLTRELESARAYELALVDVEIGIKNNTAEVSCIRQITVRPAVGRERSALPRTTIFLERAPTGWLITNVR